MVIITPRAGEHSLSPETGGLKYFGAFDGSRRIRLLHPWPAVTQTYYWMRYFSCNQLREAFILNFISTAIPRERRYSASNQQKTLFLIKQLSFLPFRFFGAIRSIRKAKNMLKTGPQIPDIWSKSIDHP